MSRPSWHQIHMRQAELMAERSTCARLKVGAVLVKDNRTISQGYNGVGPGSKHCTDVWHESKDDELYAEFLNTDDFKTMHKQWSLSNELHAEQNCILWAGREGIATNNTILYTIYSPCINCAKIIHTSGIKIVYYKYPYENDRSGIEYLQKNNINVVKII